ncbi:HEAT repeat domain-containing protein, partial [candidate division KSB1 bacterium]
AYILGEIADSRSIKPLMKTLKDHSHHVRSAAIGALAKIGAVEATRALAQVINKDPEPTVRREAAIALGKFGAGIKEAADALIRALTDKSRRVRAQAARAQGRLGDPKAVTPLIHALDDSYWSVRSNAFNSLVSLGPVALPGLIEAFETLSGDTRLKVLEVIAEMGQPGAIEPLQGMLKPAEKDKEFREKVKKTIETLKMKEKEEEEV